MMTQKHFVNVTTLGKRLSMSRVKLTQLADAGLIPFILCKQKRRRFDVEEVVYALKKGMRNGTRTLQTHTTGRNGPGSTEVAETQADREGV
jgi:hypothetical protein